MGFIKLAVLKTCLMKKLLLLIITAGLITTLKGQYSASLADNSFRYVAAPGFVNITELNYSLGMKDTVSVNSKYYYGVSNLFGYQIDRHFFGGVGIGYFHYDGGDFFPFYLEYKYSRYFRRFSPYLYGDGGVLVYPEDISNESKIFINPGIGISRAISSRLELAFSAGYMVQARSTFTRVTFVNFKLGLIYRKNSFRMFRKS